VHASVFTDPWPALHREGAALHGEAKRIRGESRAIDGEATPMSASILEREQAIVVARP
jgi:hypothetical protein